MDALSPHCIVEIENRRFDSWSDGNMIASSVELTTDKSGEGSVELYDPDFKIIDGFLKGGVKPLQARFWYGWEKTLKNSLFVGTLARVEWSEKITTFRFHDHSAKMKKQKKTRYFKKKTDIQILRQLAADNGLTLEVKGRTGESQPIDSLAQSGVSDWRLALKIAERAGLKLYVSGTVLFAVEAGTTTLDEPAATLRFEKDFTLLRGFNLTYKLPNDGRSRRSKTEVRGRGKNNRQLKGVSEIGNDGSTDIILREDLPTLSVAAAKRRADGKASRRREYAFEHRLEILPSFQKIIDIRNVLTLTGFGGFFSGKYVTTEIRYNFSSQGLSSELTVGADLK